MGWTWLDPVVSLLIAAVIVVGTWSLFRQSLHLLFDGVPDSVDLQAVQATAGIVARRSARARPAHLGHGHLSGGHDGPPGHAQGHADDAFLQHATEELHDRFEITHATLQVVSVPFTRPCGTWRKPLRVARTGEVIQRQASISSQSCRPASVRGG